MREWESGERKEYLEREKIGNHPIRPYQICRWKKARVWDISVWYCETHQKLRNSQSDSYPTSTCSKGIRLGAPKKDWDVPIRF